MKHTHRVKLPLDTAPSQSGEWRVQMHGVKEGREGGGEGGRLTVGVVMDAWPIR